MIVNEDLNQKISINPSVKRTIRDILLTKFGKIGLDNKPFGLHSLKSGGATAAANLG